MEDKPLDRYEDASDRMPKPNMWNLSVSESHELMTEEYLEWWDQVGKKLIAYLKKKCWRAWLERKTRIKIGAPFDQDAHPDWWLEMDKEYLHWWGEEGSGLEHKMRHGVGSHLSERIICWRAWQASGNRMEEKR